MFFRLLLGAALCAPFAFSQCLNFPANLIPLSSVSYVTAPNSSGDQLVVGSLAGGINTLSQFAAPDIPNETYCDTAVQLAQNQFFTGVYVPSAAEKAGNFSAFAGLLVNPATNQPYPNGTIPSNQLGTVYAFRIGPTQVNQTAKGWSLTGSLPFTASNHRSVLLPSGKVLVIVGVLGAIYDPATGAFTPTDRLNVQHGGDASLVLLNDGRAFVFGGTAILNVGEIYDPATGKYTAAGKSNLPHGAFHTSTVLKDGRVLIVGGFTKTDYPQGADVVPSSGAEVFDPKTGIYTLAGPMAVQRMRHVAELLPDGRVMIAGGIPNGTNGGTNSIEIFDPVTLKFSSGGFMGVGRSSPFSAVLPNGLVLIGGGYGDTGSAELFDPVKLSTSYTGSMPFQLYDTFGAALLNNGQVLISGGFAGTSPNLPIPATNEALFYNPASGTFSPAPNMTTARLGHSKTVLLDGRVLVTGGSNGCCSAPYGPTRSAEIYTPLTQGLVASQTGLTFRAAQSSTSVPPQSLAILSPTDDIPWAVSVKTYSGGNWLSANPSSSRSTPGSPPVTLTVNVDPTGLNAQDYYGAVTLTPTDGKHPPITVAIVFSIVPIGTAAPLQVSPTGLVFLTTAGSSPQPQTLKVTNFTSRAINFTASSTSAFFTFGPLGGTITTALPGVITVTPSAEKLTPGVYRGSIKLAFNDGSAQIVDVLMVVSAAPLGSTARGAAAACTPTKLLPVLTSVAAGATAPIAWPTAILTQVTDDCGIAVSTGSVTASFTNGDPPIALVSVGNGAWSGTWVPARVSGNTTVRVDARVLQPALAGTVQVSVEASANPKVPVVAPGGVLSSGDYSSPPAAGLLVSIFGSALADGSASFTQAPLSTLLGSTKVLLGGQELPMVYVSENQVNVLVPYETPLNAPLPLLIVRGNAISVPVNVAVFDAQPAILSTLGNGQGQGHIYRAISSGAQVLADASSPATTGDVLVIYCVGLGITDPKVTSGDAAPFSPLARITAPVAATIGGQTAAASFAGLTPGFIGLYQINVAVPGGVPSGTQPVSISVGAKSSPPGITMAVK
jgi:uncharacterized protein (TIGR03437 family)